jgi:plasmid stabilization system protein ParE
MSFRVRFTEDARVDLHRLYDFALDRAQGDLRPAEAALDALRRGFALLESSPFACRRAAGGDVMLRELLAGFGAAGYVALIEIEGADWVTVLAVRHQREDDYR